MTNAAVQGPTPGIAVSREYAASLVMSTISSRRLERLATNRKRLARLRSIPISCISQ